MNWESGEVGGRYVCVTESNSHAQGGQRRNPLSYNATARSRRIAIRAQV
jgi:hypothetical protein